MQQKTIRESIKDQFRGSRTRKNTAMPLGMLIFFLIFIWPAGLLLLGYRIVKDRKHWISYGVITLSVGVLMFIIASSFCIEAISGAWNTRAEFAKAFTTPAVFLIISLFFIVPGIFILRRGISDSRLLRLVKEEQFEDPEDLALLMHKSVVSIQKQIARLQKEARWA